MNKVYRGKKYTNQKKVVGLFAAQVIVGMTPALLLIAFVLFKLYRNGIVAIVFILLMFACNAVNVMLVRRYNVLQSGVRGERVLYRTVKKLGDYNIIFRNIPIRYNKGRSELDLLLISHKGIIIIEVKNHSGTIFGNWKADKWTQRKYYRGGKTSQTEMDNPLKQMRRQRDIVKSILRAAGEDVWIDTVLYFSSPNAKLRLTLRDSDVVCSSDSELVHFIESYKGKTVLSKSQMERYAAIIKQASDEV